MSEHSRFLKAIQRLKGRLDEKRIARKAELREKAIGDVTKPSYEREGVFRIPKTAERLIGTVLKPFSASFGTYLRRGYRQAVYRDRATGRFVRRTLVTAERSKFRAQNAARVFAGRFPNLTADEVRERVNRLTELGIRKELGDDVDLDIAELFGYPV